MKKRYGSFLISFFIISLLGCGHSEIIPFDSDRWEIAASQNKLEDYLGQKSLFLKGGKAYIKDSNFVDGILEFDIAFGQERGFMGAVWRLQDLYNYEEFYIRPHQSGNPDANQYTPVFNGASGWQLYHGEGYGAPVKYTYDEWLHVKIVVSGQSAEVYIVDMETPVLFIPELKRDIQAGKVGISASNFAPAHFANFKYTSMKNPPLKGKVDQADDIPEGGIQSWKVSNTFDEKTLTNKHSFDDSDNEDLTWQQLDCESSGLANLAKIQKLDDNKRCVFAQITITSEKDQIKRLEFGYSDRVKVYFNNQLVYGGTNLYRSRDYRYLGTIGYFDELYLPLKKGKNELRIAVSENFGGWGLKARFENMNGISLGE